MRKRIIVALFAVAAIAVYAAQDTDITPREVKDPKTLETWLEANASDAQSRLAAIEASGATGSNTAVRVGSLSTTGAVTIAEGKLADSVIVSADIKDGEIVNADINASAAIAVTKLGTGGLIPANSGASLTNMSLTCFAGKTISFVTITNMVYNGGATTGDVNIVTWQ